MAVKGKNFATFQSHFGNLPDENCQSAIETLQTNFLPFTAIVQDSAISSYKWYKVGREPENGQSSTCVLFLKEDNVRQGFAFSGRALIFLKLQEQDYMG